MSNVIGDSGDNTLIGTAGGDQIVGFGGNDLMEGLGGNDNLEGSTGNDTLDGGAGAQDVASYVEAASGVHVVLGLAGPQDTGSMGFDTLISIEMAVGGNHDDVLSAVGVTDEGGGWVLEGLDGDDLLTGSLDAGNTLYGNNGDDTLIGGDRQDRLYAGPGDDSIDGGGVGDGDIIDYSDAVTGVAVDLSRTDAQNTIGAGIDTIVNVEGILGSYAGDDTLTGGVGDDFIVGQGGADLIHGGDGHDIVQGGLGVDVIYGDGGDDTLFGNSFGPSADVGDELHGGDGDDDLSGGSGADTLDGGAGMDIADYDGATAGVTVHADWSGAQQTGGGGLDTLIGIEGLGGSAFADLLALGATSAWAYGGNGDDTLVSGAGDDTLAGGDGVDTVSYGSATSGVVVDLDLGVQDTHGAGTDSISNFEAIIGSAFADQLTLSSSSHSIDGGAGDDTLAGSAGGDTLNGGDGMDTVTFVDASAGVKIKLADVHAQNTHGAGVDTLVSIEQVVGSNFNDVLKGTAGDDRFIGMNGEDHLAGKDGGDLLSGGMGNDVLVGGAGDDTLTGGAGKDLMSGGDGADLFIFLAFSDSGAGAPDIIRDLDNTDTIDLSAVDANSTKSGNQAFRMVASLDGHAGEATLVYNAKHHLTYLEMDINGDGKADMTVALSGDHAGFANFVL